MANDAFESAATNFGRSIMTDSSQNQKVTLTAGSTNVSLGTESMASAMNFGDLTDLEQIIGALGVVVWFKY